MKNLSNFNRGVKNLSIKEQIEINGGASFWSEFVDGFIEGYRTVKAALRKK